MILALENMPSQWADTAENSRKVLELVNHPAFRLNWDPGSAAFAGDPSPFPEGYERIKEWVRFDKTIYTDKKAKKIYDQYFIEYKKAYEALKETMKTLGKIK